MHPPCSQQKQRSAPIVVLHAQRARIDLVRIAWLAQVVDVGPVEPVGVEQVAADALAGAETFMGQPALGVLRPALGLGLELDLLPAPAADDLGHDPRALLAEHPLVVELPDGFSHGPAPSPRTAASPRGRAGRSCPGQAWVTSASSRGSRPSASTRRQSKAASAVLPTGSPGQADRKSTRLNSSHLVISYAVFCLKKK